jgi:Fe-S-cluster-containing dehydrogenase component
MMTRGTREKRLCVFCHGAVERVDVRARICNACSDARIKLVAPVVARAVKDGKLPSARTKLCVDCGARAQGYDHRDYDEPLRVVPVCHTCNARRGPAIWMSRSREPEVEAQ